MKKLYLKIIILLVLIINSSCKQDEIEELYSYEDYFIETTALLDQNKEGEEYKYHITYLETDGLNNLIPVNNIGYGSTISKQPDSFAEKIVSDYSPDYSSTSIEIVKKYKKIGVILKPIKNINSFNFIISDIHSVGRILLNIDIEINEREQIRVIYDFDTNTHTIE
jgi:hypothetical protein